MSILRTRSRTLAEEQARLDKRRRAQTPANPEQKEKKKETGEKRWQPYWPSILLVLAGAVLIFGLYSSWKSPSLVSTGMWAQNNWFWVLILLGILVVLIALNAERLKKSSATLPGTLYTIMGVIAFLLFIGFPVINWFTTPSSATSIPRNELRVPAKSDSDPVTPPPGRSASFTGAGFTTHCVYSDGRPEGTVGDPTNPCGSGPMTHVYVRNNTDKEIVITYTFE